MQNAFGLILSCGLVALSCGPSPTHGTKSQGATEAPETHNAADACRHMQALAQKADPYIEGDNSACESFLNQGVALWEPKVGAAVIDCILKTSDQEALAACDFSTVGKSLGLGFRKSNLTLTDACLSIRDKQRRDEPKAEFNGPACEADLKEDLQRWQPEVMQAVFQCVVSASSYENVKRCSPNSLARQLGLKHPDKSKTAEANVHLKLMAEGVKAYFAANSTLPPAVAATPAPGCCSQGGQCQPNAEDWNTPGWKALSFKIEKPHYYSYNLDIGEPTSGHGASFTATARGDLDCDGERSTFTLYGEIQDGELMSAQDIIKQDAYE